MTLDDLIPPSVTAAVAHHGLHKIAGAMLGVPELNIGVAVKTIGERAYRRRKEARNRRRPRRARGGDRHQDR